MPTPRRARARVLVSLASLVLLGGCAGQPSRGNATASGAAATAAVASDAGVVARTAPPTMEALAERAHTEAPLLREIVRVADVVAPIELEAAASDACFRAFVGAGDAVTAWFEDAARNRVGSSFSGTVGAVPEAGPVCVRKGARLRLVVTRSAPTTARAVVVGTE